MGCLKGITSNRRIGGPILAIFGVFTVFYGLGILLYLIAWLILPEQGEDGSIVESFVSKRSSRL